MRPDNQHRKTLRSAISQVQNIAHSKRIQSLSQGYDRTALIQEARQLEEAVRLLRWITK
jgi:hypothetical protein